jgi:hypothetical protein
MKQYSITETSEAVSTASNHLGKSQDGNEVRPDDTKRPLHAEWSAVFPTAAQLLREWEGCPRVATEWDGRSWLRDLHNQWKELGRPELTWQDAIVERALEARLHYHRFVEAYYEQLRFPLLCLLRMNTTELLSEICVEEVRRLEFDLLCEYQSHQPDSARRRWLFSANDHNTTALPPETVVKNALRKLLTEHKPPEVLAEERQELRRSIASRWSVPEPAFRDH